MKKNIVKYSKGEIGQVQRMIDFLPSPKDLVLQEQSVKVTLNLSKNSIDFFKQQGKKFNVPYQRMIKSLLDQYAENIKQSS